jgi:murein DD-endopeptidase MepM/ murein hydrolase activator NlpD
MAAADGVVSMAGWSDTGAGNMVTIEHPRGDATNYFHLRGDIPVSVGQAVKQGQVIGYEDTTGRSTGVHLHFEYITTGGEKIDPIPLLPDGHRAVDDGWVPPK